MKMKFRTVLLVFLFIKLCILFTVLQETIESLNSNDHPLLFGTNDIYLFDLMLASISGLSILTSAFLIILFAIGHTRIRKPYVIFAFVINLVFVVPFFFSGVYLIFQDDHGLEIRPKVVKSFEKIADFAEIYDLTVQNITVDLTKKNIGKKTNTATTKPPAIHLPVSTDMIKTFKTVEHIQKRYCCCGLSGASDYGFDNTTTAAKMSIPFTSKLKIQCPHNSLFKNSTCIDSHLKGCEERLKTVYPTRIMIYSCIGSVFSVVFAILSPFIYSQFELDRRRARSKYIRDWRHSLETHVNDHRMWYLRKKATNDTPEQSIKLKQSPISPGVSSSNPTHSSKSKESIKKGEKSN